MSTMKLYLSPTDRDAFDILAALDTLQVAYTPLDIDADDNARAQLQTLTNTLDTPTLALDDDTVLIRPTPQQFAEALGQQLDAPEPAQTRLSVVWVWLKVLIALLVGLVAFGLGRTLGKFVPTAAIPWLVLGMVIAFIGCSLLSQRAPFKAPLSRLQQYLHWSTLKWIIIPLYASVLGLGLTPFNDEQKWPLIFFMATITIVLLGLTVLTRIVWQRWETQITAIQSWLGMLILIGFVCILVLGWLDLLQPLMSSIRYGQLALLGLLFGLGSFQIVAGSSEEHAVDRASGMLFPCVGLIMVLTLW